MLDKVTEVLNEIIQILKDEIEIVLLTAIIISSLLVVVILGKIIRTTLERRKNEKEVFNFLEGEEKQDLSEKTEEKYVPTETTYIEEIVAQRLEADLPDRAKRVEQIEEEEEIQTFFAKEEATWEEEMKKAFLEEEKESLQEKRPIDYLEERKINSEVEKEIYFTAGEKTHSDKGHEDTYNIQQTANSAMADDDSYYDQSAINCDEGGNLQLILPSNIIEEISRLSARNLDEIEIKIQGAEVKLKYAGNTTLKNGKGHVYQVGENPYNEKGVQSPVMCEVQEDETKREERAVAQGKIPYDIKEGAVREDEDLRRKRQKPGKQLLDGEQKIIQFEEMLEEMEQQHVKESQDTVDVFVKFGSDNCNTTKTGRVFTEKELEEQIRD